MQSSTSRRFIPNTLALFLGLTCLAAVYSSAGAGDQGGQTAAGYYNLAMQLHKKQDFRGAVNALDKAIALAPNVVEYHLRKADCLYQEEEDDAGAILELNKVLSINPNDAFQWQFKARILSRLNRYEEAIECVNKAIKIRPGVNSFYKTRAFLFKSQGCFQEAEDDLTAAIRLCERQHDSNLFYVHMDREGIAAKLGHWPLVITDTTIVINTPDPQKPVLSTRSAWLLQAQALTALKKTAQARQVYLKALAQWPDDRQLRVQAKEFFESLGDKANAQIQVKKLQQIDSDMVPPKS